MRLSYKGEGVDRTVIEEKTRQVIMETLDLSEADCIPETALQADPLGLVQLAMQLEFKFGIEIDEDSFVEMVTVQDVLNLINSKMGV